MDKKWQEKPAIFGAPDRTHIASQSALLVFAVRSDFAPADYKTIPRIVSFNVVSLLKLQVLSYQKITPHRFGCGIIFWCA